MLAIYENLLKRGGEETSKTWGGRRNETLKNATKARDCRGESSKRRELKPLAREKSHQKWGEPRGYDGCRKKDLTQYWGHNLPFTQKEKRVSPGGASSESPSK